MGNFNPAFVGREIGIYKSFIKLFGLFNALKMMCCSNQSNNTLIELIFPVYNKLNWK